MCESGPFCMHKETSVSWSNWVVRKEGVCFCSPFSSVAVDELPEEYKAEKKKITVRSRVGETPPLKKLCVQLQL